MKKVKSLLIVAILTATSIAIISPITGYPAQAQKGKVVKVVFTKVKQVAQKLCEWGGCWYVVEEVSEYFTQDTQEENSCGGNDPKGCTIRTGGGTPIKIGERRRIISKTRIR